MIFFFAVQPRNDMINYLERSAAGAQPKGSDVPEHSLSRFELPTPCRERGSGAVKSPENGQ